MTTSKTKYRVIFQVDATSLATLLAVVEKDQTIELEALTRQPPDGQAPAKKYRYANGKRNKGISGEDLVVKLLAGGRPSTAEALKSGFSKAGFAPTGLSGVLRRLEQAGKVKKIRYGTYQLGGGGAKP